jgi:hypothetical protein
MDVLVEGALDGRLMPKGHEVEIVDVARSGMLNRDLLP